jgi:hypothetical protein
VGKGEEKNDSVRGAGCCRGCIEHHENRVEIQAYFFEGTKNISRHEGIL